MDLILAQGGYAVAREALAKELEAKVKALEKEVSRLQADLEAVTLAKTSQEPPVRLLFDNVSSEYRRIHCRRLLRIS